MKTFDKKLRLTQNADGSVRFEVVTVSLLGVVVVMAGATLPKGPASEAGLQVQAWTAAEPMPATTTLPMVKPAGQKS
jgi:hypothetical protein